MKKIRCFLASVVLVAALSGPALLGMGAGSMANLASSRHAGTSFVAGQTARAVALRLKPPCPVPGHDC